MNIYYIKLAWYKSVFFYIYIARLVHTLPNIFTGLKVHSFDIIFFYLSRHVHDPKTKTFLEGTYYDRAQYIAIGTLLLFGWVVFVALIMYLIWSGNCMVMLSNNCVDTLNGRKSKVMDRISKCPLFHHLPIISGMIHTLHRFRTARYIVSMYIILIDPSIQQG